MKEVALNHPILTFLLCTCVVDGIVKVAYLFSVKSIAKKALDEGHDIEMTSEEEETDGSSDTAD